MDLPRVAQRIKIFIGEGDKHKGKPLHEAIVMAARKAGLAGATVTRGILGFGASSRIHSDKILRLSEGLPVVVEIVDSPDRVAEFMPRLEEMVSEGLITLEEVRVIAYSANNKSGPVET